MTRDELIEAAKQQLNTHYSYCGPQGCSSATDAINMLESWNEFERLSLLIDPAQAVPELLEHIDQLKEEVAQSDWSEVYCRMLAGAAGMGDNG